MSDIRLTSSDTKMKINLCIFLLCNTAVSVFGQSMELNGILGESVKFPAAVKNGGFLMHSNVTIGDVTSGSFRTLHIEKFSRRLQWDSSTGLFSLSGLKMEDIGEYKVQNTDQNINTVFQLNVYTERETQELNGIMGKNIEFLAAVKIKGNLMYSGVTIGIVTSSSFKRARSKFNGRLEWNNSTGLFSLSGLRLEDSGEYKVQNTDQKIITVFQLNVYIPVLKPNVRVTHNKYPCKLMCTVEGGTGVTLSWYREDEKESISHSSVHSAPFNLSMRVERSGTYTCEAANSVSNEKASITVGADCRGGAAGIWQAEGSKMWSLCLVLIVMLYSRLV